VVKDAIGREWQTGTIQCDFNLPERLDATFIGDDSEKHRPVMLHRAILGSLERFIGVLIENYAGKLPLWLTPRQVVIATITSDADGYAEEVKAAMVKAGLRAETDIRNEKINYKVREHSVGKVPVIAVVGRKEAEEGTLALRFLGEEGNKQEILPLADAITRLAHEALAPDLKRG
jgi:threonyl-tRNA synthetase